MEVAIDSCQPGLTAGSPASLTRNDDPFLQFLGPANMNGMQLAFGLQAFSQARNRLLVEFRARLRRVGYDRIDRQTSESGHGPAAQVFMARNGTEDRRCRA